MALFAVFHLDSAQGIRRTHRRESPAYGATWRQSLSNLPSWRPFVTATMRRDGGVCPARFQQNKGNTHKKNNYFSDTEKKERQN